MLNLIVSYSPYPIIYFIGVIATKLLQFQTHWSLVICVAIVGLMGSFLSQFLFLSIKKHAESLLFSGALAAMAGNYYAHTILFFTFTSIFATLIYFSSIKFVPTLGGRLGTIAFLSSGLSMIMMSILYA